MVAQLQSFLGEVTDLYQITELLPHGLSKMTTFVSALVHIIEFKVALLDAVHGRLNTFVVNSVQLRNAYRYITNALDRIDGSLSLAYKSVSQVYQSSDFIIHRYGRQVYITIKFPITMQERPFTLYDLRIFPVLMPDDSPHTTVLDTKTAAFAYDPEGDYYLEFPTVPTIKDHMLYMPNQVATFKYLSSPSCIVALFQNRHSDIVNLCSFLSPHSLKPLIMSLDESHILLIHISNMTRVCDGTDSVLPGCTQCIYALPCTCTLYTNDTYIPPHVTDCITDIDTFNRTLEPRTHVANLAVLTRYFSSEDLAQLTASTILKNPISAVLPSFSFLDNRNFSDTLASLEETKFDLSRAVNLSISRQLAFRSIAEYLSHQHAMHYEMQNSDDFFFGIFNRFRTPLMLASIGISLVAISFTVIVSVKLRTLSLLLLNIRSVQGIRVQLDFFAKTTIPTLNISASPFTIVLQTTGTNIFLICLVGLFAILLIGLLSVYVYNKYFTHKFSVKPYTKIFLQLNTNKTQIYLHFLNLYCNISSYMFIATDVCLNLKVSGIISPMVIIEWPTLFIKHAALNEYIPWPNKIKLSYSEASTLRKILTESGVIIRPLFYYTRPGFFGPKLVIMFNEDQEKPPDQAYHRGEQAALPIDPTAPREEPPIRLYPIVP